MSYLSVLKAQATSDMKEEEMVQTVSCEEKSLAWADLSSSQKIAMEESFHSCYIYKVPKKLRVGGERKYTPYTISIGPYHRHVENLVITTNHKIYYLNSLLSHNTTPDTILTIIVDEIKKLQGDARKCYAESIDMSDEEFVRMLILDGCFILELLYRYELKDEMETGGEDILFSSKWIVPSIRRDLILLENQIPFSVLVILYELTLAPRKSRDDYLYTNTSKPIGNQRKYVTTKNHFAGCFKTKSPSKTGFPTQTNTPSFAGLIINFFDPILPTITSASVCSSLNGEHLLDLLRHHLVASHQISSKMGNKSTWEHTTSATDLNQGGVKLKRKYGNKGLFDVTFQDGIFEVPPFFFGESWTVLLPNMIVLEQCRGDYLDIVTSYVVLMDNLIDSPKDVKLLRDKGIIEGSSSEDDVVAHAVNNMCREFTYENFYYDGLCNQVNAYRQAPSNRWKANFKRNYIKTPWVCVSLFAAVFLLVLTLAQTIFTVLWY